MPRRRNLGSVNNETAQRLLRDYMPIVYGLSPLFPRLDPATLRATGEDAILEAHLSFDSDRASQATWTRRVVYWRLSAAAKRTPKPTQSLDVDPEIGNGANPEDALLQATVVHLLSHLSIRQQQVVDGRMRGETYAELGSQLGISGAQAHREGQRAFEILRDLLEDAAVY